MDPTIKKGETNTSPAGATVASAPETLPPGFMVDQYQITGILGRGGMGTVYSGIQPVIGKQVAIKVINREFSGNPEVVARFIQEARAVNQARSRYIVDIFGFGELPDGCHYCVMEHVEGQVLEDLLREQRGHLPLPRALEILRGITAGLASAHAMNIIHRDLKPGNILVPSGPEQVSAKLLDFGIAKMASEPGEATPMTRTGAVFGTPAYMAPEQIRAQQVDTRTDIYALGVIMFQLFTGELPFEAVAFIDLVNKHLNDAPPDPSTLRSGLPVQLRDLVLQCLKKDPDQRPESVEQVAAALEVQATAATLPAHEPPPATSPLPPGDPQATHHRPRRAALLLVALIPLLLVGAWLLMPDHNGTLVEPKPAAAPAPNPEPERVVENVQPAADSQPRRQPDLKVGPSQPAPGPDARKPKKRNRKPAARAAAPAVVSAPDLGPPPPAPDLRPPPKPEPERVVENVQPAADSQPRRQPDLKVGPSQPAPKKKPAPAQEEVPFGF